MAIRTWDLLDSRCLIRDRWMRLRADRCRLPSGVVIEPYYVQEPPDWVQIVAFDAADRVLITRQYRHAAGLICEELPCGAVESGESPEQAIRRELLEETGCAVDELIPLSSLLPNPATCTNRLHAFLGRGTRQAQAPSPEETEDIEFEFLPVPEVLARIESGAFRQALHIATLLLALTRTGAYVPTSDRRLGTIR